VHWCIFTYICQKFHENGDEAIYVMAVLWLPASWPVCHVGRADLCNSNLFFARWTCKNWVAVYWIVDRQLCHAIWLLLMGSAFFCLSYVTLCSVVNRPGCWTSLQSCICWLLRSSTCYSVVSLTLFQRLWHNNTFACYTPSVIWCCWATSSPLTTLAPGWPQTWNTQGFL